jgi:hypothetical protein
MFSSQWQGLGDIINSFRAVTLGIEPLNRSAGPSVLESLRVPYTYCWSEGLIQKPPDWGSNVGEYEVSVPPAEIFSGLFRCRPWPFQAL